MDLSSIIQNRIAATTGTKKVAKPQYLEADLLYRDLADLVNETFRLWYCHMFNKIGRQRVLILASQARADGTDPKKLFSYLLRKENV